MKARRGVPEPVLISVGWVCLERSRPVSVTSMGRRGGKGTVISQHSSTYTATFYSLDWLWFSYVSQAWLCLQFLTNARDYIVQASLLYSADIYCAIKDNWNYEFILWKSCLNSFIIIPCGKNWFNLKTGIITGLPSCVFLCIPITLHDLFIYYECISFIRLFHSMIVIIPNYFLHKLRHFSCFCILHFCLCLQWSNHKTL